jgi:hypothetical protein
VVSADDRKRFSAVLRRPRGTSPTVSEFPRKGSRRYGSAHTVLVITLVAVLVGSFGAALPPTARAASHGDPRVIQEQPTPPPSFDCIGYGAALDVLSPSPAAGIAGSVFELEGSGYYNRTSGPLGSFTIWMANYSGGSLLYLTSIAAGVPVDFFVNVTVPSENNTTAFPPGPYEFWSLENYTVTPTCANFPFTLTGVPPPSIGCLSWTARLNVTSPSPANGAAGSNVALQGSGFAYGGNTSVYWSDLDGSSDVLVGLAAASDPGGWFNLTVDAPATGYAPGTYAFWGVDGDSDCAGGEFVLTGSNEPTLTLDPTSGLPGKLVAATGIDFAPNSPVTFTFDGGAVTSTCTTNGTGSFPGSTGPPCTFTVPRVQEGDDGGLNVVATDGLSNTARATFFVSSWLLITSTPTTGAVGTPVTAVGSGWPAGETISHVVFGVSLLGTSVEVECTGGSPVVNSSGGWSCSFAVPPIHPGTYWVIAVDAAGLQFSNNTFTVSGLMITSSPLNGPVGSTLTVNGTGWIPEDNVEIGVGPVGTVGVIEAGVGFASANTTGEFTFTFTIPTVVAGAYWALAYDSTQNPGGGPGTIVNSTNAFTVTAGLTITNPIRTGGVGTPLTVEGTGWTVGETIGHLVFGISLLGVSVEVYCSGGSPVVNTLGEWSCSFTAPSIHPGTYWVIAVDPAGLTFSNNTFTVSGLSLTSTPTTGPVGTQVTVTGTGWIPGDSIAIGIGPVGILGIVWSGETSTIANATGGYAATFAIPDEGGGAYWALAYDSTQNPDLVLGTIIVNSTNSFTVTAALSIVSTPTSGPVGTTVTAVGSGWPIGESIGEVVFGVSLLGVSAEVSCGGGSPVVNATGGWSCTFPVPPIHLGTYWVIAVTPAGLQFSTNTFSVTSPSSGGPASVFGIPILDLEVLGGAVVLGSVGAAVVALRGRGKAPRAP